MGTLFSGNRILEWRIPVWVWSSFPIFNSHMYSESRHLYISPHIPVSMQFLLYIICLRISFQLDYRQFLITTGLVYEFVHQWGPWPDPWDWARTSSPTSPKGPELWGVQTRLREPTGASSGLRRNTGGWLAREGQWKGSRPCLACLTQFRSARLQQQANLLVRASAP